MKKRAFTVLIPQPPDYKIEELRKYVEDAVRGWSKEFFPGDEETAPDGLFVYSIDATVTRDPEKDQKLC